MELCQEQKDGQDMESNQELADSLELVEVNLELVQVSQATEQEYSQAMELKTELEDSLELKVPASPVTVHNKKLEDSLVMELKKELVGNQEVGVVSPVTELSQDQDLAQVSLATAHNQALEDSPVLELKAELVGTPESEAVSLAMELS
ncbi:hypothetical protein ACLKA6_010680 [Drosophila palustris]